jgi:hypothetical protein
MMSEATMAPEKVRFHCPHCGKLNKASTKWIGLVGNCARCGGGVKIPARGGRQAGAIIRELRPHAGEESVQCMPAVQSHDAVLTTEDVIEGFSSPPAPAEESLEDLGRHVATSGGSMGSAPKARKTPLWLWALHLSLPIGTIYAATLIYQARTGSTSPVIPPALPSVAQPAISPVAVPAVPRND